MTDLVRIPGHLRRAGLAALVAACLVFVVGPAAFAQDDQPANGFVIRQIDGTDPTNVGVTFVWTGKRADLEQMTLREEGRLAKTEPPVPLARAGVKRSLVLVLDRSASMENSGSLAAAKKGLTTLVSSLGDDEKAALVTFDSDVAVSQSLTTDHSAVRRAIDDVKVGAQESALFDAVKEGASLVGASEAVQPNIVLVTDGFDDISTTTRGQILGDLSRSSANLFAVSSGTLEPQDADLLSQLVERAGGQSVAAADAKGLDAAFTAVQSTLTNQYVVTYASTAEQGATEVELTAAGQTASKSFVPGSVARGSSALDPKEVGGSPLPDFMATGTGKLLGIGGLFLAVALGVYAVASLMTKNESVLDSALNPYTDGWSEDEEEGESGFSQTALFQRAVEFTGDFAEKQGLLEKVEQRLEQANLPLRAAEAIFVYVAAVAVVGLMLLVLNGFFVGILATVLLALIPPAILNFLAKRRQKAFEAQLPDMLQLLSGSLRAGYSLMQGVEAVSQEVAEPMGKELRRVCTEARLGRELEESLDGVAARMDSPDFEWAIMAIRIQREVGGNLAELLLTVGETMINRERMRREVAALTAEGKISAIVLGILPPAIAGVMFVVNPAYMKVLFSETMGNMMLGAGVLMMVVGFTWMMKTIKIEI
jgi:tight adherence protein B